MYQPYPPGGQSAEPLRPPAPAPVLTAVRLMWLLWRPASSAFFKPPGITQAGSGAAISSRIRSSRARPRRQW